MAKSGMPPATLFESFSARGGLQALALSPTSRLFITSLLVNVCRSACHRITVVTASLVFQGKSVFNAYMGEMANLCEIKLSPRCHCLRLRLIEDLILRYKRCQRHLRGARC